MIDRLRALGPARESHQLFHCLFQNAPKGLEKNQYHLGLLVVNIHRDI